MNIFDHALMKMNRLPSGSLRKSGLDTVRKSSDFR
jgi:hypothetical protein